MIRGPQDFWLSVSGITDTDQHHNQMSIKKHICIIKCHHLTASQLKSTFEILCAVSAPEELFLAFFLIPLYLWKIEKLSNIFCQNESGF
jgi:hypothetical protein